MKPWEHKYVDLSIPRLTNEEFRFLYDKYPNLPKNHREGCPTCDKRGTYLWKDKEHECDCEQQFSLHKAYLSAGIGELYQRLDWPDFQGDEKAIEIAYAYLSNYESFIKNGVGLMVTGGYGQGKTLLCSLVAKELVKLGYNVFFTTFQGMIVMFTEGWYSPQEKQRFKDKIMTSDVLILDDIGKEYQTKIKLNESTFDYILRERSVAMKPTFLTTNMTEEELGKGYGGNILSLISERSHKYETDGYDFRQKAKDRSLQEILNGWQRPIF